MTAKKDGNGDGGSNWMKDAIEKFRAGESDFHPEFDVSDAELESILNNLNQIIEVDPDPEKRTGRVEFDVLTLRQLVMSALAVKGIVRNYFELQREVNEAFKAMADQAQARENEHRDSMFKCEMEIRELREEVAELKSLLPDT